MKHFLIVWMLFFSSVLTTTSIYANELEDQSIPQLEKLAQEGDTAAQFILANEYYLGERVQKDDKLALYWYKKVAVAGYPNAQFNVGNIYHKGMGVDRDVDRAMIWYEKAANQSLAIAAYNLGILHFEKKQNKQGLFWYQKAAELGYMLAQLNLAQIYTDGLLVSQNPVVSEKWYKRAVNGNSAIAEYQYAVFLEEQNRMAEAVKFYKKSANSGYFKAQYQLAYLYRIAKGVKQNDKQAFALLQEAVKEDYAPAQYLLGVMYKTYQKDMDNAILWYKKAAENGNYFAQYSLGVAYLKGDGVEKNPTTATRYFINAAESGYSNAQYSLAIRYLTGEGIKQDYKAAIKWLRRAAKQNHPYADYSLALRYKLGQGVEKDIKQRIIHLERANALGNQKAKYELAMLAVNRQKTSLNPTEAQKMLARLAKTDIEVAYELGKSLVNVDKNEAIKYLNIAAAKNHIPAKQLLALLDNSDESLGASEKSTAKPSAQLPQSLSLGGDITRVIASAENGDVIARYQLAYAHLTGNGVSEDIEKGIALLRELAKEEYALAQHDLSILYKDGIYLEQNYQLAYYWTVKALQNDHAPAAQTLRVLQNLVKE